MRLADCFVEAATYTLDVARKPASFPDYAPVRAKAEELLNAAGRMARSLGVAAQEFQDARFAMCAWMDETILSSRWEGRSQWLHQPLQRTVYNTVNAGEEYFDRLDALLADGDDFAFDGPQSEGAEDEREQPAAEEAPPVGGPRAMATVDELRFGEARPGAACKPAKPATGFDPVEEADGVGVGARGVLEVYALTLLLGFTGRHFHPDDRETLRTLRQRALARALGPRARYGLGPLGRLAPDLYAGEGGVVSPRRRFWRGLDWVDMVVVGVPLLATAALYFSYTYLLAGSLSGFLGGP